MSLLPALAMLGQRGIRMRGDLGTERGLVGRTNAARAPGTGQRVTGPGEVLATPPATKRGWIDPVHGGDVTLSMASLHSSQGAFTDVVRGVRASHPPILPAAHNFRSPL